MCVHTHDADVVMSHCWCCFFFHGNINRYKYRNMRHFLRMYIGMNVVSPRSKHMRKWSVCHAYDVRTRRKKKWARCSINWIAWHGSITHLASYNSSFVCFMFSFFGDIFIGCFKNGIYILLILCMTGSQLLGKMINK